MLIEVLVAEDGRVDGLDVESALRIERLVVSGACIGTRVHVHQVLRSLLLLDRAPSAACLRSPCPSMHVGSLIHSSCQWIRDESPQGYCLSEMVLLEYQCFRGLREGTSCRLANRVVFVLGHLLGYYFGHVLQCLPCWITAEHARSVSSIRRTALQRWMDAISLRLGGPSALEGLLWSTLQLGVLVLLVLFSVTVARMRTMMELTLILGRRKLLCRVVDARGSRLECLGLEASFHRLGACARDTNGLLRGSFAGLARVRSPMGHY